MKKIVHMMTLIVPKFRPDQSARLKDIAEKHVPAKLKPVVGIYKGTYNADTLPYLYMSLRRTLRLKKPLQPLQAMMP